MLILAFDTSAVTASAAIAEACDGQIKKSAVFSVKNELKHSEKMLVMTDALFKIFGAEPKDIGLIGCAVGPGSFTGVRIGASLAKGFAFGNDIPCVPVSTLEALAQNTVQSKGIICPVMDARREQFYNALFVSDGKTLSRRREDRAIPFKELAAELEKYPDVTVCGDGLELFNKLYGEKSSLTYASYASRDQNAVSVALCAYNGFLSGKAVSCDKLDPVYLRPPQAVREAEKTTEKDFGGY